MGNTKNKPKQKSTYSSNNNFNYPEYDLSSIAGKVASIANNSKLQSLASKYSLNILNITWEDTARSKQSCFGPNISDMTLKLVENSVLLPVIRKPNFSDETTDVPLDKFMIPIGNESGSTNSVKISLKEYLTNPKKFIKSENEIDSLIDPIRDENILCSPQFCILPLKNNTCEFNVHLFNYQSYSEPAVLVLVVNNLGTSAQTLVGDQPLFFNNNGKACNFVAERLADERERLGKVVEGKMTKEEEERNYLMIFQVPLKVEESQLFDYNNIMCMEEECLQDENCYMERAEKRCCEKERGMDDAMIKIGNEHSEFEGIRNKKIKRDLRFPIRCTFQFYKVTDSDEIPENIFKQMKEKIDYILNGGITKGSLVVEQETGRTTEIKNEDQYKYN